MHLGILALRMQTRIGAKNHIWTAEMRIPIGADECCRDTSGH